MDKLLLREPEACQVLGVSRTILFQLMRSGAVESIRIGRSRRIPAAALAAYVEKLRAQQGEGYSPRGPG